MSYDVDIVEIKHSSNYTFNIYEMFTEALKNLQKEELLPDWYNHWTDVLKSNTKELNLFIKELKSKPDYYKQYNPKNEWGSYDGGIKWLEEILKNWKPGYRILIDK